MEGAGCSPKQKSSKKPRNILPPSRAFPVETGAGFSIFEHFLRTGFSPSVPQVRVPPGRFYRGRRQPRPGRLRAAGAR